MIEYLYQKPKPQTLIIAGPPGTEEKVRELYRVMYGGSLDSKPMLPARFYVLRPDEPANVDGIEIFPFHVPHQSNEISFGLKVSYQGKQVLFSGDSLWTDRFIDHARGADLFLCECSFFNEQPGMHVNYQALRANLARLECNKLILTHLGEEMLARKNQLEATVAADGMVIEV